MHPWRMWSRDLITQDAYFGLMSHKEPPTLEVLENANELIKRVNLLLESLTTTNISAILVPVVNSGWRPASYNATIPNAAKNSKHILGQAVDIADPMEEFDAYVSKFDSEGGLKNSLLEQFELWREAPIATRGWIHLASVPPPSGKRTFIP